MQKNQTQSLQESFANAQSILLPLPKHPKGDVVATALALAVFLRKQGKHIELYCAELDTEQFAFLPESNLITTTAELPKSFVISLSTQHARLEELSYDVLQEKIEIYLHPSQGTFKPEDVSMRQDDLKFNAIVCLGTPQLELLGQLYEANAELFFKLPKINIDNRIENQNYGNVNVIDITCSSIAEIVYDYMKTSDPALVDEQIATLLLAGIIAETSSFQNNRTTPHTFAIASELVTMGANQQEIIRNMFKTKDLAVLKLWGRAMARVKDFTEYGALFSAVNKQDVERSGIKPEQFPKVADEFAQNSSVAKMTFLAIEGNDNVHLYVQANPNIKLQDFINQLDGEMYNNNNGHIVLPNVSINNVEAFVTQTLHGLKGQLGL